MQLTQPEQLPFQVAVVAVEHFYYALGVWAQALLF